jgi:hypothetical protein
VAVVGEKFMIIWGDDLEGATREQLVTIVLQQQELLLQYQDLVDAYRVEFAKLREMYGD